MAALLIVSFRQKIRMFQPVILAWIGGISVLIAGLVWYLTTLDQGSLERFSSTLSSGIILLIFLAFLLGGWRKKVNMFDAFVEGAKGGFEIAVRIIPYLIAMLVAISVLQLGRIRIHYRRLPAFIYPARNEYRFCGSAAYGFHEASERSRGQGYDGGCHEYLWGRLFHWQVIQHLPGHQRSYILCGGGLFRGRIHKKYALCHPGDVISRSCRRYYRYCCGIFIFH